MYPPVAVVMERHSREIQTGAFRFPTGAIPHHPMTELVTPGTTQMSSCSVSPNMGGKEIDVEGFKSNMPAFADVLSDEEIWAVLAYIKSSWPAELLRRQKATNQRTSG